MPDLYSVKGSGDFRDQTHNGLCVHRDYETGEVIVKNLKAKFKNQGSGSIGSFVTFNYDLNNGRYYDGVTDDRPLWERNNIQKEIEPIESDIEPSRLNALSRQSGYAVQDDNSFETSDGKTFEYPF